MAVSYQLLTKVTSAFKSPAIDLGSDKIRLLTVHYGLQNPVWCSMTIESRTTAYVALSYVWGNDEPSHPILIDGQVVQVRQNLHDFLIRCASSTHSNLLHGQKLWIDALCIDQQNIPERNHQVRRMNEIYAAAEYVTVWLGNVASVVEDLFGSLSKYRYSLLTTNHGKQKFLELMVELGRNSYWKRLWIVPELFNARQIILLGGGASLPESTLLTILDPHLTSIIESQNWSHALAQRIGINAMLPLLAERVRLIDRRSLGVSNRIYARYQDLFNEYGEHLCADDRDRVFALMTFAYDRDESLIDYNNNAVNLARKVIGKFVLFDASWIQVVRKFLRILSHGAQQLPTQGNSSTTPDNAPDPASVSHSIASSSSDLAGEVEQPYTIRIRFRETSSFGAWCGDHLDRGASADPRLLSFAELEMYEFDVQKLAKDHFVFALVVPYVNGRLIAAILKGKYSIQQERAFDVRIVQLSQVHELNDSPRDPTMTQVDSEDQLITYYMVYFANVRDVTEFLDGLSVQADAETETVDDPLGLSGPSLWLPEDQKEWPWDPS